MDIVRRKLMLVTTGTLRVKTLKTGALWVKELSSDVNVSYPVTCYGTTRQHNIIAKRR